MFYLDFSAEVKDSTTSSGRDSGPTSDWNEIGRKYWQKVQVGIWLRRRSSLKGRVEVFAVYILLLIFYRLFVLHLLEGYQRELQ